MLTRLREQWQASKTSHPFIGVERHLGVRRAEPDNADTGNCLLNRIIVRGRQDQAPTETERQEVFDRDRSIGRHRIIDWSVDTPRPLPVRQLGQERLTGSSSLSLPSSINIMS